jgi:hypothetical protein
MRYAAAGTLASDTRYTRRYRDAVMLSRVTASAADVERLCPLMSARLPRHALAAAMHARARCCRCCCRAIGARAPAQSRGSMPIAPMFYYASFAPQAADSFLCDAQMPRRYAFAATPFSCRCQRRRRISLLSDFHYAAFDSR